MKSGPEYVPVLLAGTFSVLAGLLLWPRSVVLRSDDFGYVESVVAAIQGSWLPASHWLEPFNLILPWIGAGVFAASGSFYASTMGVVAVLAGLNLLLLWRWLRPTFPEGWGGDLALVALAFTPVALNKTVEFTGVPLSWLLLLASLLAWRARMVGWFYLTVVLGVMNRQSAVCLLMLPLTHVAIAVWRGQPWSRRWLVGLAVASVAILAVIWWVPPNFARQLSAERLATPAPLPALRQLILGIGLAGGLAAGWALLRGESTLFVGRTVLARPWASVAWLAAGATTLAGGAAIACEAPQFGRFSSLWVAGAFALAAALPRAVHRVAPELLAAGLLYVLLVSWRGVWWDYYVCDLALLLAWPRELSHRRDARVSTGLACALAALALAWVIPLWGQLRWAEGSMRAYEHALRSRQLSEAEMSQAPFGTLGWKVFPALVERREAMQLSDFVKFVEAGRSSYSRGTITLFPPGPDRRSLHGSGEWWQLPADYVSRPLPLDDAEWREWLRPR